MNEALSLLRDRLVRQGDDELRSPRGLVSFTGEAAPDSLINDIDHYPHAFVLAALTDRQVDAKIAWRLPQRLRERLGTFEMGALGKLGIDDWLRLLREPTAAHRFVETMATVLHKAVQRLLAQYGGDASRIWADNPPSKVVVNRFLEFHGAGPKIATMAANILVRYFHVPMSDYRQIDISADVQVCRVMGRLGFVAEDPSVDAVVRAARALNPDFPGIFDLAVWELGRTICRPASPRCAECPHSDLCSYFNRSSASPNQSLLDSMAADLTRLASLRDKGLITDAEYASKKADWLNRI